METQISTDPKNGEKKEIGIRVSVIVEETEAPSDNLIQAVRHLCRWLIADEIQKAGKP